MPLCHVFPKARGESFVLRFSFQLEHLMIQEAKLAKAKAIISLLSPILIQFLTVCQANQVHPVSTFSSHRICTGRTVESVCNFVSLVKSTIHAKPCAAGDLLLEVQSPSGTETQSVKAAVTSLTPGGG